jgi:hypothetical protein
LAISITGDGRSEPEMKTVSAKEETWTQGPVQTYETVDENGIKTTTYLCFHIYVLFTFGS